MFDLEHEIAEWRRQLAKGGIERPDLLDELESHLREDIERLTKSVSSEADAFQAAVRELGDGAALGKEFATEARPEGIARAFAIARNVLGWWFILMALNTLVGVLRILLVDDPRMWSGWGLWSKTGTWNVVRLWTELAVSYSPIYVQAAAMVLIGLGLLRRWNTWGRVALVWCCLGFFSNLISILLPSKPVEWANPITWAEFGMVVPSSVGHAVGILSFAMFTLGVCLLTGSNDRSQFRRASA